jgi:hypothetical protein
MGDELFRAKWHTDRQTDLTKLGDYKGMCILIVTYVLFCTFCCHRANWHSSATLTEVFPCFFLSCKANARV